MNHRGCGLLWTIDGVGLWHEATSDRVKEVKLLNAAWVLNVGESLLGSVCYFPPCTEEGVMLLRYYVLREMLRRVQETQRRKREGEWKEPWEISRPILQAPQLRCSSHSPHWLPIAGANWLGEKPLAGEKWNHLNSSTHTYPAAPSFSASPSPPLCSALQASSASKAWKRNMETHSVASLTLQSSFFTATSLLGFWCQLVSQRRVAVRYAGPFDEVSQRTHITYKMSSWIATSVLCSSLHWYVYFMNCFLFIFCQWNT